MVGGYEQVRKVGLQQVPDPLQLRTRGDCSGNGWWNGRRGLLRRQRFEFGAEFGQGNGQGEVYVTGDGGRRVHEAVDILAKGKKLMNWKFGVNACDVHGTELAGEWGGRRNRRAGNQALESCVVRKNWCAKYIRKLFT